MHIFSIFYDLKANSRAALDLLQCVTVVYALFPSIFNVIFVHSLFERHVYVNVLMSATSKYLEDYAMKAKRKPNKSWK